MSGHLLYLSIVTTINQVLLGFIIFVAAVIVIFGADMANKRVVSVEFEIHGIVQGVFFRKYTQREATKLGLVGWCMNSEYGTVVGELQGEMKKVQEMKHWLEKVGSPSSKIERAEFRNEKEIKSLMHNSFAIRR